MSGCAMCNPLHWWTLATAEFSLDTLIKVHNDKVAGAGGCRSELCVISIANGNADKLLAVIAQFHHGTRAADQFNAIFSYHDTASTPKILLVRVLYSAEVQKTTWFSPLK